ncbi:MULTISPECIES: ABC transporter substrate-binding protein [unclassified Rathayibacter]|uniref:ABC transporter substrate-binding protein n=1 Tax=unclassified Rathayibacter TaxID=2609250 RepID=UPI000F4B7DC9|nr:MULTISPECIES: ABC transporter substrate-binding protein [unclassified Rathayibacter]ROP49180.1 raffinose/stachyose/melibiose transport system substrate-binding protein [Rathayibacter sp. PhB186]ROS50703.1 raffinose/stachyose/melibiose transport system substrate-binding protein [Rathayibacter sp. PhB185]
MKFSRIAGVAAGAAAIALLATGCSASGSGETSADGTTTINYWGWDGAPGQDVIDPLIDAFEAENPDITVDYTEVPRDDYKAKVASALGAGEDIDVLAVQPGAWAGEIEDYLSDVTAWPNADALTSAFTDTSIEQTKRLFTDGGLYAVPLYSTGSAIGIYNADILDSVGVAAPTTVSEFTALSEALKAQSPDILPAVMPAEGWFQDEAALTVVGQTDPSFFDEVRYEEGEWDTDSYVTGLESYKKLYDDGVFAKDTLDMDYATATNTFDTGEAAVLFNGSWEAGRILTGNYGIIPFPAATADEASLRAFLDVTIGIPEESTKKDAASTFVEYLAAGDGVDVWATSLKGVPAVDGYTLPEGTLTTDLQKQSYATMVDLISDPHSDRNNLGAFSDFVGANVLQVLTGSMSAEDAAASDQAELEKGNF